MRLKIGTKLLLFIIASSALIYIIVFAYLGVTDRQRTLRDAMKLTDMEVNQHCMKMKTMLDYEMAMIKTLSYVMPRFDDSSFIYRNSIYKQMYSGVFEKTPQFYAIWDSWEKYHTDSGYTLPYGRWSNTVNNIDGQLSTGTREKSPDGDPADYGRIKVAGNKQWFEEPYMDGILMTSLISPFMVDDKFVGVVGADISLERFQKLTANIKPHEGSFAILLSNEGKYVSAQDRKNVDSLITLATPELDLDGKLLYNIRSGNNFSYLVKLKDRKEYYISFAPVQVVSTDNPWSLAIAVPTDVIMEEANQKFVINIFVGVLGLLVLAIVTWIVSRSIAKPLVTTTLALQEMATGNIDKSLKLNINTNDETGDIAISVNKLIEGLNQTVEFADDIGRGNYTGEFTLLSENDTLGNSLLKMRNSLVQAEEEKRKRELEDEKQRWTSNGLAKFGDILRQNNDNIQEFSYDVISNLVKYLEANQGGLFVIEDSDKKNVMIEMVACYAYDRRKLLEKKIEIGVSLVGRCVQEGAPIYLTDIPDEYMEIRSGLGTANPNSLLLMPLKVNDEIFGVIELASFCEFEPYHIEFVSKVGESIASTLASVKVNMRTAKLLEQSKEQAERLAQQEEEMRQNMEEMMATQEESNRREEDLIRENAEMREELERLRNM